VRERAIVSWSLALLVAAGCSSPSVHEGVLGSWEWVDDSTRLDDVMTFTGTTTSGTLVETQTYEIASSPFPEGSVSGCTVISRLTSTFTYDGALLMVTPASATEERSGCDDPTSDEATTTLDRSTEPYSLPLNLTATTLSFGDYDPPHVYHRID
jgi:hypothetical protein